MTMFLTIYTHTTVRKYIFFVHTWVWICCTFTCAYFDNSICHETN